MPNTLDYNATPSPFNNLFDTDKSGEPTGAWSSAMDTKTAKGQGTSPTPSMFSNAVHPLVTLFHMLFGQDQASGMPVMATAKPSNVSATPVYGPKDVPSTQSLSSFKSNSPF